ncbi:MAG: AAA family ATPase [Verrucomicrobiota bacterium]
MSNEDNVQEIENARKFHAALKAETSKIIVGQETIIDYLTYALLCGGHALLVGVPGLAKTLLVRTIAEATHLKFKRIQFTPDLMPADITGTTVLEEDQAGHRAFEFMPGPIFANIILADEINRTPPKTQSALLESMQERSVTAGGETRPLEPPFFVLATQNPIEQEGTYPLPEAQLDRFLFNLVLTYPPEEEEVAILQATTGAPPEPVEPLADGAAIIRMQNAIRLLTCAEPAMRYAVHLVSATRPESPRATDPVKRYLRWGSGPRGAQFLILAAKARAAISGRFHVEFEDIVEVAKPVLRHRLLLNYHAEADNVDADRIIDDIIKAVARP